jgi:outer membrane lipoprotein-sorting protein
MRALLLVPLVCVLACRSSSSGGANDAELMAQVREKLAARDAKLLAYQLEGTQTEGGSVSAGFSFAYRAPQKMRGTVSAPQARQVWWDGKHLYEQVEAAKQFTTFTSQVSAEKLSAFLTEIFTPFVPEGFRAPLLLRSAKAKRVTAVTGLPQAKEAVELSMALEGDAAGGLEVTYVLRWPSLDFLAKRTRAPDGTQGEVRMEEEHCDASLGLCVPKKLTRWLGNEKQGETLLTRVDLKTSLPNDAFTPTAPDGYSVQTRTLVDSEAQESGPKSPTDG